MASAKLTYLFVSSISCSGQNSHHVNLHCLDIIRRRMWQICNMLFMWTHSSLSTTICIVFLLFSPSLTHVQVHSKVHLWIEININISIICADTAILTKCMKSQSSTSTQLMGQLVQQLQMKQLMKLVFSNFSDRENLFV